MEAIERVISTNDWVTFIFLGIVFLLWMVNHLNQQKFHRLVALPFDSLFFTDYERSVDEMSRGFNIFLFIASNLVLSLFLYFIFENNYPLHFEKQKFPFLWILIVVFAYWIFRHFTGSLLAWVFDLKKLQKKAVFVKMSYFFSIHVYLLFFLLFGFYFFKWNASYLKIVMLIYIGLWVLRYIKFLNMTYKMTFVNLFYFILYLCALEIAPLLLLYKIGLK